MQEVSVVVELLVRVDPKADPVELEHAVAKEGRRAARELYAQAVKAVEDHALEDAGAKQRLEPRWVAASFGRVRVWRYRAKGGDGTTVHPLDRAMGWSQAEPSAGLRELVCDLATRLPYRQTADVAARIMGEPFSARSAWQVLQDEGTRVRTEEGELAASVFELGEAPPTEDDGPHPKLVVVEADGTFLRAQREQTPSFEVKTGVFYTAKERAGGRRHRRWRLVNKGCYATTATGDVFGPALAARGFAWVGLHRADNVLCVHDGVDDFGQTFRDWFPGAVHQIDHFHLAERVWEAAGGDRGRFDWLADRAFNDPTGLARRLRSRRIRVVGHRAEELPRYLDLVAPHLHGVDRLPARLRRGRMRVVGSAVVEKHQDLVVKRRMKGRGMRWTRRGADNLLALQARRFCNRWPSTWGVRPA